MLIIKMLLLCLIYCSGLLTYKGNPVSVSAKACPDYYYYEASAKHDDKSYTVDSLNKSVQFCLLKGNITSAARLLNTIYGIINGEYYVDSLHISDSYYFSGVLHLLTGNYPDGVKYLGLSASIRENLGQSDTLYVKCLYNLGAGYGYLGDFRKMNEFSEKSVNEGRKLYGKSSPELLKGLTNLVITTMNLKEYEKSIDYANEAISILNLNKGKGSLTESDISDLYLNIGVCYFRLADYSKAMIYLERAEYSYLKGNLSKDERYINLLNNLAVTYGLMGMNDKSAEYYEKGLTLASSSNTALSFNIVNSYAILLGNIGNKEKGARLLEDALARAEKTYGKSSRDYFSVLNNYAEYLRTFNIDIKKSLELYEKCYSYILKHEQDIFLKDQILTGYSLTLSRNGNTEKAIEIIQNLLFTGLTPPGDASVPENPDPELLQSDQRTLSVLRAKYRILWDIYLKTDDINYLKLIANTSELVIRILEKVRINISEEESRLILGNRYRDSYLLAIRDLNLCYQQTNDLSFLEKAFVHSEKSKVAGLLAATRELKAVQLHIPENIASAEQSVQNEISQVSAEISEEKNRPSPDFSILELLNNKFISLSRERDSLIKLFESNYPEYYQLKYNTEAVSIKDVPKITGKNSNYLSYVVSDSVVYLFILNRKYCKLVTIPVDPEFFSDVEKFRTLLISPSFENNAGGEFMQFKQIGYRLYKSLLLPAENYLISNRLIISPDNILSYIPFETLPIKEIDTEVIQYRYLPYVMNKYSVSYIYSATFMAVSAKKGVRFSNKLVAFAPVYEKNIIIDSSLNSLERNNLILKDLPYAREEARFITDYTEGKLYNGNEAKESVFKSEAPKYDIVHLAMHTIINDQLPMKSSMIFYADNNSTEDNLLNTYEVYGIHLKAKMVVLSSCNTGLGALYKGEGIISLARGFMYSGSQSVVMAMWEVEDKSATDIVKNFYSYLSKGKTKSEALRLARQNYLKKADMLHSHPYFWATLIVYGENNPVYYHRQLMITGILILLLPGLIILYRKLR